MLVVLVCSGSVIKHNFGTKQRNFIIAMIKCIGCGISFDLFCQSDIIFKSGHVSLFVDKQGTDTSKKTSEG